MKTDVKKTLREQKTSSFEKGQLSLKNQREKAQNEREKFFHLTSSNIEHIQLLNKDKSRGVPPLDRCRRPPKSTHCSFKNWCNLGRRDRGVGHSGKLQAEKIKTLKKEIVVVVLERNKLKQKKMDKTGKQQQKRTELYKFKRNSLIPD